MRQSSYFSSILSVKFYVSYCFYRWLPLGVLKYGYFRSNSVTLEVNDMAIIIGGDTYENEYDWAQPSVSEEVKIMHPSAHDFSLWDMPSMLEPRSRHAAAAISGNHTVMNMSIKSH